MSLILLISTEDCDHCGRPSLLFVRTVKGRLCATCFWDTKVIGDVERWLAPPKRKRGAA